jgi:hypothetical protein
MPSFLALSCRFQTNHKTSYCKKITVASLAGLEPKTYNLSVTSNSNPKCKSVTKTLHLSIMAVTLAVSFSFTTSFALGIDTLGLSQILSPLKQFEPGIKIEDIKCMNGFELVTRTHDGTPACVKPDSNAKLVFLGWASIISQPTEGSNFRIIGPYDGLDSKTGIVKIQNQTFFMTTFNGTLSPATGYQQVEFHGIGFTLFPIGALSLEVSGREFYSDIGFQDGQHEQLWLEPPIYSSMQNLTITRLTHHMQPQAGIISYNEKIKLLVSTDNQTLSALKLYLSTNSTSIQLGQAIGIDISVNNTLSRPIMALQKNDWAFSTYGIILCAQSPVGISILDGYYTEQNMTKGKQLALYGNTIMCPMIMNLVSGYEFAPLSSQVTIYCGTNSVNLCGNDEMRYHVSFGGFWKNEILHPFNLGTYTIIGADEWGHVAIKHFVVTNSKSINITENGQSLVVNKNGTLTPIPKNTNATNSVITQSETNATNQSPISMNPTISITKPDEIKIITIATSPNPLKVGDKPQFKLTYQNISNKAIYQSLVGCGSNPSLIWEISPSSNVQEQISGGSEMMKCPALTKSVKPIETSVAEGFGINAGTYQITKAGELNVNMKLDLDDGTASGIQATIQFNVNATQ